MSIAGRKPLPKAIHELNGNPSKINFNKLKEPEPKVYSDSPDPPKWLDETAKEEWRRVSPELSRLKILTESDFTALEAYCKTYSRWKTAESEMDRIESTVFKAGKNNYIQQLPQVAIAQKYLKLCQDFMVEFGLTPSSRGRMRLPSEEEGYDEMDKLLKG